MEPQLALCYHILMGSSEHEELLLVSRALQRLQSGFPLPPTSTTDGDLPRVEKILFEVADRLRDNFPYFHPLYAGQMLKPPHSIARLAYALAMYLNPNNHAFDGGRASSAMEKEAVAELGQLFGWTNPLGHLCSGGTMANLEALWVASRLHPGKKILASHQAHYTHERLCAVLGLSFVAVDCDRFGRLDLNALEGLARSGGVGTVVATIGTTATGSVDPLTDILALGQRYGFRVHADAAYGGYFVLADNLREETRRAYTSLADANSIVIDPHKHGLQPYGCGCVLFRDPTVGKFYKHDSPYTYFTSAELHLGEISLECSRAGAAAVALWATQKLFPLVTGGEFAQRLDCSREAALSLYEKLRNDPRFIPAFPPELDIVVWFPKSAKLTQSSVLSQQIFEEAARNDLHLALASLPVEFFDLKTAGIKRDADRVLCLRSVLMKPEHQDWVNEIWQRLGRSANTVGAREQKIMNSRQ